MKKLIPLLIASILLSSCGDTIKDTMKGKSVAEPQIAEFHKKLDAGQYEEIYNAAAEEFKKNVTKEKMTRILSAISRKLGTVKSKKIVNWHVNTRNLTTHVILVSETEFEKGTGTETFSFIVSGSNAKMVGYNINSVDMMLH